MRFTKAGLGNMLQGLRRKSAWVSVRVEPETFTHTFYIAGPMRGRKWFNFEAFDAAKAMLEHRGHTVISPADMDREVGFDAMKLPADTDWHDLDSIGFSLRDAVSRDVEALMMCDAIYMLDGWGASVGARAEHALAQWLGLTTWYQTREAA